MARHAAAGGRAEGGTNPFAYGGAPFGGQPLPALLSLPHERFLYPMQPDSNVGGAIKTGRALQASLSLPKLTHRLPDGPKRGGVQMPPGRGKATLHSSASAACVGPGRGRAAGPYGGPMSFGSRWAAMTAMDDEETERVLEEVMNAA